MTILGLVQTLLGLIGRLFVPIGAYLFGRQSARHAQSQKALRDAETASGIRRRVRRDGGFIERLRGRWSRD